MISAAIGAFYVRLRQYLITAALYVIGVSATSAGTVFEPVDAPARPLLAHLVVRLVRQDLKRFRTGRGSRFIYHQYAYTNLTARAVLPLAHLSGTQRLD